MTISRRSIVGATIGAPFAIGAARAATSISIHIDPRQTLGTIPNDFMGLGYEISQVAVPGVLSAENRTYVQLVRNLGRQGVIRVGGNTSDFSSYDPNGRPVSLPKGTVVNTDNIHQLRTFLDAIAWKLIWGINLGDDKLDNALEEAKAISEIIGDRLLAFQIGNEPDLFVGSGHRQTYDYATWHAEYRRYKAAIREVLPHAKFAGPDVAIARNVDWFESFARDEGTDAVLLTAHHYIGGQANPASTLEQMLEEEKKFQSVLARFRVAANTAHLPYRLCETASYSGGGKAGVSDTFAAALWALDYLFVVSSYGCAGVNMETGVNHLGWISHYTPISDDLKGTFRAAPEYYGLLAFAEVQGERVVTTFNPGDVNLTAYATRRDGEGIFLTVINKDMTRDAKVEAIAGTTLRRARIKRLTAPSLMANDGIKFGGMTVEPDGMWQGGRQDTLEVADGRALVDVPAGSAAVILLST
jgi:hypothetical protein